VCGIVGYIGNANALHVIIPALQRLEYRGYDSAGIAVIHKGKISIAKKKGKISSLISYISDINFPHEAKIGIGHTRWATHGEPSDNNAHPHSECTGKIAIVHNGIIENYLELKKELEAKGHKIKSETDTEIVAHLIEEEMKNVGDFEKSFKRAIAKLEGSYAIVGISAEEPDKIIATRKGAPLVVGIWDKSGFIVSSDIPSLLIFTKKMIPLDDGEIAVITSDSIEIVKDDIQVEKEIVEIKWSPHQAEKGGYKHFMLKEIFEQPHVVEDTISEFLSIWDKIQIPKSKRFIITACGTSFHAGLIGKIWIEQFCKIPVEVEYASELRYKDYEMFNDSVVIAISQSGETADTLEAVRRAKSEGAFTLGLVNVLGSTMTREVELVLHTSAGPEIGVAATKTFSSQLTALILLAIKMSGESKNSKIINELRKIPAKISEVLKKSDFIREISEEISGFKNAFYLGRWISYPVAMEGALKLKEISYIHAEAYPAGEMKHGPIALISPDMLSIFIVPKDRVYRKTLSNIQEVIARHGKVIAVTTGERDEMSFSGLKTEGSKGDDFPPVWVRIGVPEVEEFLTPFVTTPVLQLIAYHTACVLGHDVDQPRNLAKSVTVE